MPGSTDERGRRAFGPTVLLGLLSTAVAVLAASNGLIRDPALTGERFADLGEVPLALAVAIITLLCWGLVLVLPGHWRRGAAVIGLLAALGIIGVVDFGLPAAQDDIVAESASDAIVIEYTTWFWVLMVAALLAALTFFVAFRHAHLWPGMSRRYDAPGARPAPDEPASNQDLWKALDEGRDPTAPPATDDN